MSNNHKYSRLGARSNPKWTRPNSINVLYAILCFICQWPCLPACVLCGYRSDGSRLIFVIVYWRRLSAVLCTLH